MSEAFTPTCCVLTISDRCAAGERRDTAGPALARLVNEALDARVAAQHLVPDEREQIQHVLKAWARQAPRPDLVLTTGGTGLAPRDVTPEATAAILERRHPGLLELARLRCYEKTPLTFLSRGEAGTVAQTLILNLPGSERGASEMLEALTDVLPHALAMLRDEGDHPKPSPGAAASADPNPATGEPGR